MKQKIIGLCFFALCLFTNITVYANVEPEIVSQKKAAILKIDCTNATAQYELNINNVRATLLNGGDSWWNLNNAGYKS